MASASPVERSVIAHCVPAELTKNKIHMYFQKKKNGGGECEVFPAGSGSFLILFEEKEVAERVISQRIHNINGREVNVKRRIPEIFPQVEASLNPSILADVPRQEMDRITSDISSKGLTPPTMVGDKMMFRGTWAQLQTYRKAIETHLENMSAPANTQTATTYEASEELYNEYPSPRKDAEHELVKGVGRVQISDGRVQTSTSDEYRNIGLNRRRGRESGEGADTQPMFQGKFQQPP